MRAHLLFATFAALLLALGVAGYANASSVSTTYTQNDAPAISTQHSGGDTNTSRDNVQVWTVMAAGGAAALGLVFYLVRVLLGRVAPPPPREEAHH